MFNELLKVNIKACPEAKLRVLVRQTRPVVTFHIQATEELIHRCDNNTKTSVHEEIHKTQKIAATKCSKISQEELSNISEDDFDVILDMTANSLRFRKDPAKHTELKESKLNKIGAHRMQILAYMLEHPGDPFYSENIYKSYAYQNEARDQSTFTKTIEALRKAFEQNDTSGPYIIKQSDWNGITGRKRGYVYKIVQERKYMVIRHTDKISEQIHV